MLTPKTLSGAFAVMASAPDVSLRPKRVLRTSSNCRDSPAPRVMVTGGPPGFPGRGMYEMTAEVGMEPRFVTLS